MQKVPTYAGDSTESYKSSWLKGFGVVAYFLITFFFFETHKYQTMEKKKKTSIPCINYGQRINA